MRYRELLEWSTVSQSDEKAAVQMLIAAMEQDDECWPLLDWRIEQGRDPHEAGDDEDSGEYERHLEEWCVSRVDEAAGNIAYQFNGDEIHIWRAITAPRDWTPEGRHPGVCWSWEEDAAEAHWAVTNPAFVNWVLEAIVHSNQIDWVTTLYQNAHPSFDEEKEIRLIDRTPVKLISAKHDGDLSEAGVIKLRGFGPKTVDPDSPATKMLRDVETQCAANPLNDRQLVYRNVAVFELFRDFDDREGSLELKDIRSIAKNGGKQTMDMLCGLADQYGVRLTLFAKGYAHTPTKALVQFYDGYGFQALDDISHLDHVTHGTPHDGVEMERAPKTSNKN
jgi:hypothetical protein